ncbi:hypothetical protein I4U23_012145 [Adineta vaga]|nr:hypothetical protein I4U23_012145 [Adineta vaga]
MIQVKRFVVIGETGSGKSAFINAMYNYCYGTRNANEVFEPEKPSPLKLAIPCKGWTDLVTPDNLSSERDINDQTKSQTTTTNTYSLKIEEDLVFELIDTPGFNDTNGVSNDQSNLEQIEKTLSALDYLSGIIIVANGANVRIGTSFQHFLSLLHEIWPNSLMDNVCVVLTNCDAISCNLNYNILHQLFNVSDDRIFQIQNNVFAWTRTNTPEKVTERFRENFKEVIDTMGKIVSVLEKFNDVLTDDFKFGNIQQSLIDKSIQDLIERMISLLCAYQDQSNAEKGILNAKRTMEANKNTETNHVINALKYTEVPADPESPNKSSTEKSTVKNMVRSMVTSSIKTIKEIKNSNHKCSDSNIKNKDEAKCTTSCTASPNAAGTEQQSTSPDINTKLSSNSKSNTSTTHSKQDSIPTYKTEEVKIQLTLPDNIAISQHEGALQQATTLGSEVANLGKQQETLRVELDSLIEQLMVDVQKMRQINEHVDLLQKHEKVLRKFSETIKTTDNIFDMKYYFDTTVTILSKPSSISESTVDYVAADTDREPMETEI